ncbi:transcriptional regulator, ArsR family [Stanieria cyanosphaera PCC 7437]|uniref:Transcriptional regulator, ArsR family n=1 Tax=Stanieria cyanosphaera (strain ATCC 29371 / PCC 7437) TaxID=111780 RepID=K9XWX9_STAC7|nr:metalloregulator ArsR/SmtB family transcription factor [Stanieria cyanosphaera]AFZ36569.1 transcriptional regulator, ArsR family [Stanieria cyanosphaera PCC 7437]
MPKIQSPTVPTCETVHALESNRINQLDQEKAQRMAEFFRLLGDANRLRILSVLAKQKLCVCDLAAILEMSESAVSHQLRTLRSLRLVSYQKQGRKVYYDLQDHHVLDLYNSVVEHLDESETEE